MLLFGCREKPEFDRFGNVRVALPAFRDRIAVGTPASGLLERGDRDGAAASIAWDADERQGPPGEAEALQVTGIGAAGKVAEAAPVGGHAASSVTSADAQALVWRCDKTHRLFRIALNDRAGGRSDLEQIGRSVVCHGAADRPVNGDVPVADVALLGPSWTFARRQPAAGAWLRDDAVLTLFAGERAQGPRDPASAMKTAPGWAAAAGLKSATALAAAWTAGPEKHQALRVVGRASLDGRAVRFTLLQWRCIARGKSFAALVFTTDPSKSEAPAANAPWTPHDDALLAARCHG